MSNDQISQAIAIMSKNQRKVEAVCRAYDVMLNAMAAIVENNAIGFAHRTACDAIRDSHAIIMQSSVVTQDNNSPDGAA